MHNHTKTQAQSLPGLDFSLRLCVFVALKSLHGLSLFTRLVSVRAVYRSNRHESRSTFMVGQSHDQSSQASGAWHKSHGARVSSSNPALRVSRVSVNDRGTYLFVDVEISPFATPGQVSADLSRLQTAAPRSPSASKRPSTRAHNFQGITLTT